MRREIVPIAVGLVLVLLTSAGIRASETDTFKEALTHYEGIRIALLNDSLEGVADHAREISEKVTALGEELTSESAGVPEEKLAEVGALLPEIAEAAEALGEATDLEAAREAMFGLSKPMGRYRKMAGTEGSIVAYCPMVKKAWIQPDGELGNPYMGQSMARCGQVIAD